MDKFCNPGERMADANEIEKQEKKDILDFVSGVRVKATPEEIGAVQVFSKRLVEEFGYTRSQIQTRPQYRVRKSPSDEEKSYPVDIAVFQNDKKTEDNLFIIIECKAPDKKKGESQLKLYMDMSSAEIGVWFNGNEHLYLRKILHKDGKRTYQELPSIPRRGQRIEDIGLFKRKDLKKPSNLKATFLDIRNHLAGMTTGITRDESLAQEIINLLFCKIYDELNTGKDQIVSFRCGVNEPSSDVRKRIVDTFEKRVKGEYQDVFGERDAISLDAESLVYVVGELQNYCIIEADRDAVGDAFEVFIGPALRGAEGQFFTPRNVIRMAVEILDPKPGEKIIDPACGSGGFLLNSLEYVWKGVEEEGHEKGWSEVQIERKKRDVASKYFRGIDKDSFLAKVTKAYMAIVGDGRGGVFCENSLLPISEWDADTRKMIEMNSFDIVLTNPPFGKKIVVRGEKILSQYELGYKWKKDKQNGTIEKSSELHDDQPPQVIFLDRCLQLLKKGGRMGIVLPEAIFGMPTYEYVIEYLRSRTKITGIVSMPEALFKTSGKGGTHAKVCVVFIKKEEPKTGEDYKIFMADAKWCGHDSRGNPTIRKDENGVDVLLDDIPRIVAKYKELTGRKDVN